MPSGRSAASSRGSTSRPRKAAIAAHVGDPLGLDAMAAAEAIVRVANAQDGRRDPAGLDRARARSRRLRAHAVRRRRRAACRRADRRCRAERRAGAALPGHHLGARLRHRRSAPRPGADASTSSLDGLDAAALDRRMVEAAASGARRGRGRPALPIERIDLLFELDMHYLGQTHTVTVPLPVTLSGATTGVTEADRPRRVRGAPTRRRSAACCRAFRCGSYAAHGRDRPPPAFRSRRARAGPRGDAGSARGGAAGQVWFGGAWHDTAIWSRLDLPVGAVVAGPGDPGAAGRDDGRSIPALPRASTRFGNIVIAGGHDMSDDARRSQNARCCSCDLQNDFMHPRRRLWPRRAGRARHRRAARARCKPLAEAMRAKGGWIVSTHFTLVPGKGGEPLISPHLQELRPFLHEGRFRAGRWGHALVDELAAGRPDGREDRLFRLLHDAAGMGAAQGRHRASSTSPASSPMAASPRRCATRMCATSRRSC